MHYNHHMLLTLDIGNTAVEAMVFRGPDPSGSLRFPTPEPGEPSAWDPLIRDWPDPGICEVIVSSVVPGLNEPLAHRLLRDKGLTPRFIDHGTPLEIELAVNHPQEVGADRIADVVGALDFASPPFLVIDSGTALTVDVLDAQRRYLGGVIVPGVDLSIRCLATHAARLERVEFRVPDSPLGRNTADCIRAGVFFAHLGGIEYLVREYRGMVGEEAEVITTGGAMRLFRDRLTVVDQMVPDLIHRGLRRIHAGLQSGKESEYRG